MNEQQKLADRFEVHRRHLRAATVRLHGSKSEADAVGIALLVVLDTLSPAERLAFVLHDLFAVHFEEVARIRRPLTRRGSATRQSRPAPGSRRRHRRVGPPGRRSTGTRCRDPRPLGRGAGLSGRALTANPPGSTVSQVSYGRQTAAPRRVRAHFPRRHHHSHRPADPTRA